MPIYTYKCKECEYMIEKLRSINKINDSVDCPECGGVMESVFNPNTTIVSKWKGNLPPNAAQKDKDYKENLIRQGNEVRRLKMQGKIPIEERIHPYDKNV